jgi:hypothetical protein
MKDFPRALRRTIKHSPTQNPSGKRLSLVLAEPAMGSTVAFMIQSPILDVVAFPDRQL